MNRYNEGTISFVDIDDPFRVMSYFIVFICISKDYINYRVKILDDVH